MATDVINPKYTVFDLGYEKYLAKSDSFYDDQGANADKVTQSLPSILIGGGGLIGNITMVDGFLQSSNYVAGLTGWKLTETTAYLPSIDLSGYLLATGGAYKTAATGSRVEIFPDVNTGIIAYDDDGNTVFTVLVGGTNQGDVVIGDFANSKGVMWDKSAGTFIVKGSIVTEAGSEISGEYIDALNVGKLTAGEIVSKAITLSFTEGAGDCVIRAGKTDFGQYKTQGFILGIDDSDSNKAKFEITGGEIYGSLINLFFGNGDNGSKTLDGSIDTSGMTRNGNTYTMNQDLYLIDLTINSGITLITNGYALHCVGTLTNNGTIHNNGSSGVAGENGKRTENSLPGTTSGGAGGAGGGAVGSTFGPAPSGASGGSSQIGLDGYEDEVTDGGAGIAKNPSLGGGGTNGGTGSGAYYSSTREYYASSRGAAGIGGAATAETLQFFPKSTEYTGSNAFILDTAVLFGPSGKVSKSALSHSAGAGGGGAGQCARGEVEAYLKTYIDGGGGGGGGGTGGVIYIAAKNIVNYGTIQSLGGAGGNGGNGNSYPAVVSGGRGGGGAGGTGGVIILVYENGSPGSFSAGSVAGGAGGFDGTGGSAGGPSFPASDGQTGGVGKYYLLHLTT